MIEQQLSQADRDLLLRLDTKLDAFMSEMRSNADSVSTTLSDHEIRIRTVTSKLDNAKGAYILVTAFIGLLGGIGALLGTVALITR